VSELGEVLELLHTSAVRWRTIRMAGYQWFDPGQAVAAFLSRHPDAVSHGPRNAGPPAGPTIERWRLWIERPDLKRAEFEAGGETVSVVIAGNRWCSWSPSRGARTDSGENSSHGTGPGEPLLWTAMLLPALDVETRGRTTLLGRAAISLEARPRGEDDGGSLVHLGMGAERYELVVDAERGILLRSEALLDGRAFKVVEVEEVAFDQDLSPEMFSLTAPSGEGFEAERSHRQLPFAELSSAVPFTVLVPEHPDMVHEDGSIESPDPRLGRPLAVRFSYERQQGQPGPVPFVAFAESAEPMPELKDGWRTIDDLRVRDEGSERRPRYRVVFQRRGTHVEMQSAELALEEVLALARSLVPLPSGLEHAAESPG